MRTLYRAAAVRTPSHPAASALLVDDDGRVAWTGPAADADRVADPAAVRVVDLGPALVTPAFVDAHAHVTETGLLLRGVDLRDARSVTEILDRVAAAARAADGDDGPVLGHGWDEALLAEHRPPPPAELDAAGGGRPVYLSRVDVHSAVVSGSLARSCGAAALDGWDATGRVERDAHHAARDATRDHLPPAARRAAQLAALHAAAAAGIACLHEMSAPHLAPEEDLRALAALAADPAQALPQVVAYRGHLVGDEDEARDVVARLGVPVAGLAGDLCVDGSVGSRTAAWHAPYADAPDTRGHLYLTVEQVRDHVAACTRAGLQAGFHVIGDAAVDTARRGLRRAAEQVGIAAVRAAGHRLEHLEGIDADGVADLADLHVTASVQPAFDLLWGGPDGMYATRLGAARALAMNPLAALAARGVPLAFGSDSPVTPFDPWGAVRAAAGHHEAGQRLAVDAAFAAHTVGGWRAARPRVAGRAGANGTAGLLVPGAPATFAVWATRDGTTGPGALPGGLVGDGPAPRCLLTVHRGRVLHDAAGITGSAGRTVAGHSGTTSTCAG